MIPQANDNKSLTQIRTHQVDEDPDTYSKESHIHRGTSRGKPTTLAPLPNFSSTLPSLILQVEPLYISPLVVCGSGMDERIVNGGMPLGGVRGAPFIAQGGRFPRESNMGTLGTAFGRIRATLPPKLGPIGAKVGPGDPGVWPAPGPTSRAVFRPGHCQVGPHLMYVGAGALYVSFLCQMGPSCECDA